MSTEIKSIVNNLRKIIKLNRENDFNRIIYDCNSIEKLLDYITNLQQRIDKAIEHIEKYTRWFDSEYAIIYGELCSCQGANSNRLEVMVNPSNLLNILKGDDENGESKIDAKR